MAESEFGLHYHQLLFKVACGEKKGAEFQRFFEQIMQRHDPSFLPVKPSGKEGDWKSDGYSQDTGTVYQCYAPEGMTHTKAAQKIKEDFDGARLKWGDKMKGWIFVWSSHEALPPQAVAALQDLRAGDHGLAIDDWGREHLWSIVRTLSPLVRTDLLGAVPTQSGAPDASVAEIRTLLTFLSKQSLSHEVDNLDLTGIAEKLSRNRLSDSVRTLVTPGLPVAKLVADYVARHPDADFSARVADALAAEYRSLASQSIEPDEIFWKMLSYTAGGSPTETKRFWAALGIVGYYFELCDIFER